MAQTKDFSAPSTGGASGGMSRGMSIVQLRSFVEVYRQGSVSKAARELGLTQPAVSGHISSLEAQIERKLFTRHARGVRPTVIADELALRVSAALDTAENALAEAKARSVILSGTIHLCGPSDILSDLIADRLRALTANDLGVQLIPANDQTSVEMLVEGRSDFAFVVTPIDDPRIDYEVYGEEELLLVASPAIAAQIDSSDSLADALMAAPHLNYDIQSSVVSKWLEHNDISLKHIPEAITAPDMRALRNFVAKGLGWSVIPRFVVAAAMAEGTITEVKGPVGNPMIAYHIFWLKSAMRNPRTAKAKSLLLQMPDGSAA